MKLKLFAFSFAFFFCFLSCTNKEKDTKNEDANLLFDKSVELIKDFSQKLSNASDSVQIDSLISTFEKKITELNFSFPPNTDLKLSEQENDSLYKLLRDFETIRNLKLHPKPQTQPDTLLNEHPADSIK